MGSCDKEQETKKVYEVTTFPVLFALGKNQGNITLNTNTPSNPSKEQIINQALKFHSQGNISEAAKYYQYYIDQGFKDYRVFSNYGVILKSLGKSKDAELSYRKSIEIKPDYADAHSNLGNILRDLGKLKEAELSTRKAIEIKPDFADAHYNLGNILRDLGKLKEAELSTRKAIEIKPDFADAHYSLGNIFIDIGKLDEAILCYEKAIDIDKNHHSALEGIGRSLLKKGNHSDGLLKIREAVGSIGFNPKKSSITIN